MSQPPGERKEENQRNSIKIKQFSKSLNLSVSSSEKVQLAKSYHCPLADGTELSFFYIHQCDESLYSSEEAWLVLGFFGKRKCYQMLQSQFVWYKLKNQISQPSATLKNQMDEGNNAVKIRAAAISQSNDVASLLQIVPVSISSRNERLKTYVLHDGRSTLSFNNQSVNDKLRAKGTDVKLNIAGTIRTKYLETEKVKLKGPHLNVHTTKPIVDPSNTLRTTNYD